MSSDKRKEPRNKAYAKVLFEAKTIPGYLRDLSHSGCQISFVQPVETKKGDTITLHIIPGAEIGIPDFRVAVEVLWTRFDSIYSSLGGRVSALAEGENQKQLEKLYDYYAT